jgi:hypothetical protein
MGNTWGDAQVVTVSADGIPRLIKPTAFAKPTTYRLIIMIRSALRDAGQVIVFFGAAMWWEAVFNHAKPAYLALAATSGLLNKWVQLGSIPVPPGAVATVVFAVGLRIGNPRAVELALKQPRGWFVRRAALYVGAVLLAIVALLQCPGGFVACYLPLGAAVVLPWQSRKWRGRRRRLRRPTEAGFRPSWRAALSLRGRAALSVVDTIDTRTAYYSATVKDSRGFEMTMGDSAAVFRRQRDRRSEAYCVARAIEYAVIQNKFADAESLLRRAAQDRHLRGQPAVLAANSRFLTAVGLHAEALDTVLAARDAAGRATAQLQARILDACIDAGRYDGSGQWRWSAWRKVRMIWSGQLSAVILSLAAEAQFMAPTEPEAALKLAYAVCRLPDRLALQIPDSEYGLETHLRALIAKGIALDVVAHTYLQDGRQEDAGAAFLDAHEEFRQAKSRTRAAKSLVFSSICVLAAGYKEPEQESHLLDLIRVGLQLLEADRGALTGEANRAGWIASQRDLYAAVFNQLIRVNYASAKAGELGLWLLESLHRTLTANLMATDGGWSADPVLLAALAELAVKEAEPLLRDPGNSDVPQVNQPELERLRRPVRSRLSELQEAHFLAESTDVAAALATLGERVAVLYHCWREDSGWIIHGVLASPRHGIRVHQARLHATPGPPAAAALLTTTGALDAIDAADPAAVTFLLLDNPLDDKLWAEIAEAILPSSWWDVLCPPDGEQVDLLVVPDGPLASLPLAAMPAKDGKPLVEFATVAMTPALSLLRPATNPPAGTSGSARVAVVHLDDSGTGPPEAAQEAEFWRRAARHMRVIQTPDQHALDTALRVSPRPDVAAISAHGTVDDSAGGSPSSGPRARVFGTAVHLRDGSVLSAASALRLPWPETVILGACWISGVSIHAGREPFGFPLACLLRGASTIIGGIAPIPDAATASILGHVIGSLASERDAVRALRDAQRAELRRALPSDSSPAEVAGLVAWTIAPAARPHPTGIELHWDSQGLPRADTPLGSYAPGIPPGESANRVLSYGQRLASGRPVGTLEYFKAALMADNADWPGFMVACELGEPGLPGLPDGTVKGSGVADVDGQQVTATPALLKALRRGQLLADFMNDEVMLPAHVVLAAFSDSQTAAAKWLSSYKHAGARAWHQNLADRIFAADIPASRVVLGLDEPPSGGSDHRRRIAGASITEAGAKAIRRRVNWRVPAAVGALILLLPTIQALGFPALASLNRHGTLGVVLGPSVPPGASILTVFPDSAASRAGLRVGDVITSVGDAPVASPSAAVLAIRIHQPGTRIRLSITDGRQRATIYAVLGGPVVLRNAGYIGVTVHAEPSRGALVLAVAPGGPAAAAGLRAGDVIISIAGMPDGGSAIGTVILVELHHPGQRVQLSVLRDGHPMVLYVTVGTQP